MVSVAVFVALLSMEKANLNPFYKGKVQKGGGGGLSMGDQWGFEGIIVFTEFNKIGGGACSRNRQLK